MHREVWGGQRRGKGHVYFRHLWGLPRGGCSDFTGGQSVECSPTPIPVTRGCTGMETACGPCGRAVPASAPAPAPANHAPKAAGPRSRLPHPTGGQLAEFSRLFCHRDLDVRETESLPATSLQEERADARTGARAQAPPP